MSPLRFLTFKARPSGARASTARTSSFRASNPTNPVMCALKLQKSSARSVGRTSHTASRQSRLTREKRSSSRTSSWPCAMTNWTNCTQSSIEAWEREVMPASMNSSGASGISSSMLYRPGAALFTGARHKPRPTSNRPPFSRARASAWPRGACSRSVLFLRLSASSGVFARWPSKPCAAGQPLSGCCAATSIFPLLSMHG